MAHEIPEPQAHEPQPPAAEPGRLQRVGRFARTPVGVTASVLLAGALLGGAIVGVGKVQESQREGAGEGALPPPAATGTPTPSESGQLGIPTSAPRIATETPAPVCQSAEQLGPWPPEANGQFHNIEIDGTQKGAFVEAQLWLPDGPAKTEYWINMSGRRVTFKNSAGTAFQWNGDCDPRVTSAEIAAAKARRISEEVNVVELSLADFMAKYPGRVVLMPGDGTTR